METEQIRVSNAQQPKRPLRLSLSLLIGVTSWLGPYIAVSVTLLPDHKKILQLV